MRKILEKIRREFLEILPAFVFFFLMFHILLVTRSLMLKEYGITPRASAIAFMGALIVSKAIFITDKFKFLNLYPRRPLLWNVILKTFVFNLFTLLFLFIEELLHQADKHGSLVRGYEGLTSGIAWPVFWSGDIWITLFLLFYCAAVELIRAIGGERARAIFFLKVD